MTWNPLYPRPGYWSVRIVRNGPMVPARIWLAHTTEDPETGEPMDRSPHLAAQIGLEFVPVGKLWVMLEFVEASPEQRELLANPPLSSRAPRNGRAPAFRWAPMAKWRQQERARRITVGEYEAELRWLSWAASNRPDAPELHPRKRIDPRVAPIPRFQ